MKTTTEILDGMNILAIHAHPDDKITQALLFYGLAKRNNPNTKVRELVVSIGDETTVNHYGASKSDHARAGLREAESLALAKHYGIASTRQSMYPDGGVMKCKHSLKKDIVLAAMEVGANALVSTVGLTDHEDHRAVGEATLNAAIDLARIGLGTKVLQLYDHQPTGLASDIVVAHATPEAIRFALTGATHNGSQHDIFRADSQPHPPAGWSLTPDGEFVASPETIREFQIYPIWRPAYYTVQRIGMQATLPSAQAAKPS